MGLAWVALLLAAAHAAPCGDHLAAMGDGVCATHALLEHWRNGDAAACATEWSALGLGPRVPALRDTRDAQPAEKGVRDAYGEFNTIETPNFAVKWGSLIGFTEADVLALAQAFEAAWSHLVDEAGFPAPIGANTWKVNVYIGDTGASIPTSFGNAGYYWYDDDGNPILVIAANVVRHRDWAASTAAHELFHALQDAAGLFEWGRNSDWYTEATAMWSQSQVRPHDPGYAAFLWYFAARPELPLTFFDYPDQGIVEEYHHYGASIFITHLVDTTGDPSLVRRSFEAGSPGATSLAVLRAVLAEDAVDLEETFAVFLGRNATWDYPNRDSYLQTLDAGGGHGHQSHRPSGVLVDQREGVAPAHPAPGGWGANYWTLRGLHGEAVLHFDGQPQGGPEPTRWIVRVVVREGTTHRQVPVSIVDGVGSVAASALGRFDEAWLVVGTIGAQGGGTYPYTVRLEDPAPDGEPTAPCGCASGGSGALLPALLALALTRRRGSSRRRPSRSR